MRGPCRSGDRQLRVRPWIRLLASRRTVVLPCVGGTHKGCDPRGELIVARYLPAQRLEPRQHAISFMLCAARPPMMPVRPMVVGSLERTPVCPEGTEPTDAKREAVAFFRHLADCR